MALGLSFGSSKNKATTNSNATKNETVASNQNQNTNQTQTGSTTTNQSGSQATTGATKGSQVSTQQTAGQTTQDQTTKSFSDVILSALEGSTLGAIQAANSAKVDTSNDFDADAFVSGGMASAAASQQAQLEQSLNGLFDASGGTASGNSMSALLANRLQGDANASLAGQRATLAGQAAQIQNQNIQTELAGANQVQGYAAQLLAALKGGTQATTGVQATTQSQTGSQDSTQQQNQNQTNTSTSQQDTTQSLMSIINTLLNQNTNTVATEDSKTTGKKSGGGMSLAL
jgi:hypothetical protein